MFPWCIFTRGRDGKGLNDSGLAPTGAVDVLGAFYVDVALAHNGEVVTSVPPHGITTSPLSPLVPWNKKSGRLLQVGRKKRVTY